VTVVAALGEMFPGRTLRSEAGEAGSGQGWRLGPVDLDAGVVEVVRTGPDRGPDGGPDGGPGGGPDGGPDGGGDDPDGPPPTAPHAG
jgi:hypothetical protein